MLADIVERFAFRYGVIVRAPIYPVKPIFRDYAVRLREDTGTFSLNELASELRKVLGDFAGNDTFKQKLRSLKYNQNVNSAIRYLLIMIEHMLPWLNGQRQGRPLCQDPTRVLDFKTITIEHIHPTNSQNTDLEFLPYIDTLGNLTLLGPTGNNALGNRPFAEKNLR